MFDPCGSARIQFLLKGKGPAAPLRVGTPRSPWLCVLSLQFCPFLLLWAFLLLIHFPVTNTAGLFVGRVFTELHMCIPLHTCWRVF